MQRWSFDNLAPFSLCFNNIPRNKYQTYQGFFSKFLMGGDSKFLVPSVPDGDEVGWGGTCEKNPTEAKTAHLMQN